MAHNHLPEIRERQALATAEINADATEQLGLVYTPLALADILGLVDEVAQLRRLYLTARSALREIGGDEVLNEFGLGYPAPDVLPPAE